MTKQSKGKERKKQMNYDEQLQKIMKRQQEENQEFEDEEKINPLIGFSTTQLKQELRRRKREVQK